MGDWTNNSTCLVSGRSNLCRETEGPEKTTKTNSATPESSRSKTREEETRDANSKKDDR